jgi:Uma2 family endonuclease
MTNSDRIPLPYPATLSDLYSFKGKAELIDDRIFLYPLMGHWPGHVKGEIMVALDRYGKQLPDSEVYGCVVYGIPRLPSGRQSFCPVLEDYQWDSEPDRRAKRADYFLAGTQIVWDVNYKTETITKYSAAIPTTPIVFKRGEIADAEPALAGWRLNVDDLFA